MARRPSKKIALFGGSFNPPHEGHQEIVRRLAARKGIDEVWILPVWRHPFRKKLPAFQRRLALCRKFFLSPPFPPLNLRGGLGGRYQHKVRVKGYEKYPQTTGRTVDLLLYLKRRFPSFRFSWAMGDDTYRQRKKWREFKKLKRLARLVVFPRGARSPIPNVSSTSLRRKKAKKYDTIRQSRNSLNSL